MNDIFAKQNVGVPVYTWNGNGYAQSYYQQASMLDEYIHWIVGIDVVDGLKPIGTCYCALDDCTSEYESKIGKKCGFRFFIGCWGDCIERIKPTPIN